MGITRQANKVFTNDRLRSISPQIVTYFVFAGLGALSYTARHKTVSKLSRHGGATPSISNGRILRVWYVCCGSLQDEI